MSVYTDGQHCSSTALAGLLCLDGVGDPTFTVSTMDRGLDSVVNANTGDIITCMGDPDTVHQSVGNSPG